MRWVCVGPISNTAHALPAEPFTPLGINIIVSIIKKHVNHVSIPLVGHC